MLRDTLNIREFVNADIAAGLAAFAPESASFEAGRVMLRRIKELGGDGRSFSFKTTLASRSYAPWLRSLQDNGYYISLVFLWLTSVEFAIERVRSRVRSGGHDIPEETVRRRFERGRRNLFQLYLPLVNESRIFDASWPEPKEVVRYSDVNGEEVFDEGVWKIING